MLQSKCLRALERSDGWLLGRRHGSSRNDVDQQMHQPVHWNAEMLVTSHHGTGDVIHICSSCLPLQRRKFLCWCYRCDKIGHHGSHVPIEYRIMTLSRSNESLHESGKFIDRLSFFLQSDRGTLFVIHVALWATTVLRVTHNDDLHVAGTL